ncbi:hypothetical protein DM860_007404 [Cuscuta australis]|uniref:U6 snRNA-associated Sm-like protein LSm4 n=1 Tax=Cuscuta australis TaxID=267555 RepID=A0A328E599_9ASTE|nr:hypothetical protein DM860_007404 [Cuscuta australis]
MLPLSLLKTAQGHPMLVELKNGETYNGHLVNCDTWMNIHLREVICTSKDGDRFWRMPECYIRGNTIKYLRVPDEVIDKVQEETKSRTDRKPPGVGRGRGRGREDNVAGRQGRGVGRGMDDGAAKGRGKGGPGGKPGGKGMKFIQKRKKNSTFAPMTIRSFPLLVRNFIFFLAFLVNGYGYPSNGGNFLTGQTISGKSFNSINLMLHISLDLKMDSIKSHLPIMSITL